MNWLTNTDDHESGNALAAIRCVSFTHQVVCNVRDLAGFRKKTHTVPDEVNSNSASFVAKLAAKQVRQDLDAVFQQIRGVFRFKRREVESSEWEDGSGTITTPYFRYASMVYQNPEDASEAIWRRDISEITDPQQLLTDNFAMVFGEMFDTVEFVPPGPIDLERFIDHVEDLEDDRVRLSYDRTVSYCEVSIVGTVAKLHITADAIRIVHPKPELPSLLVSTLADVQNVLVDFSKLGEL